MSPLVKGILVFSFIILSLFSLGQQPAFRNYSVDDGLPSSEVYHVMQDSRGYIWMATNMGVSRFDGRNFRNFDVQNGLPENTVFEIFEDDAGRLWFISFPFQLSYFQNDSIHKYKYNDKLKDLAGHGLVPLKKSFKADSYLNIWFSLLNDGTIYKIDKNGKLKKVVHLKNNNPSIAITEQSGQLLVAQSGIRNPGEARVSVSTNNQHSIININKSNNKYSGGYIIVERTADNDILFAQNEQLTVVRPDGSQFSRNLNDRILWIISEENGIIWIGKEYTGAVKYSIDDLINLQSPIEEYLNGITITSIFKDREGGYWFTSQGDGVFYLPSKAFISYTSADGLSGSNVKYIELFQGKLFVGLEDSYYLDLIDNGKVTHILNFGQDKNKIRAFKAYKNEKLWIGTEKYLHSYDGKNFRLIKNNHPQITVERSTKSTYVFGIKDIYPNNQDEVLLGQMRSLSIVKNGKVTYDSYFDDDISLRIEAVEKESENIYLLGTFNGLWRLKDNQFSYLGENTNSLQQRITDISILKSHGGYILATKGSGLIVKINDSIIQINQNKGLSSNSVTSLLITSNELWAATNNGLNVIALDELTKPQPYIFTFKKQHGLISNEINQIKGDSSIIYIATNKGLTIFNRNDYQRLEIPPPIYLNSISVNKKDTTFLKLPLLNHDQNFITITYGGINFRDAGQLMYKYRLVGLTDNWAYSRNLQVEYAFLPSGKYKFEVYAINSEGLISAKPATLEFVIKPPFWKTWWFISSMIVVVILLFFTYFNLRIRNMRKEHNLQSDINKYREQALIRQMDPHFVFNSLNSIQSFIIKNDSISSSHYLSKFARLMRVILNNSQKQAVSLSDEVDALSLYMELESMRFKQKFEYQITVDPSLEKEITYIPAFLVQPFVENSIWHGIMNIDRQGFIHIDFLKDGNQIICTVEDNGVGRSRSLEMKSDIEKNRKSMGISIVESRLNLLSNYYNLKMVINFSDVKGADNLPAGTKVTINLPIVR